MPSANREMRRGRDSELTQARIIDAVIHLLKKSGLTDWTVDQVARRAGCAKGLVNYHFSSKATLLSLTAAQFRSARTASRLLALRHPGTEALDRLWAVLVEEARAGGFQLWLSLLAYPPTRGNATVTASERQSLISGAAQALTLERGHPAMSMLPPALDGLQLQLHQGVPETDVREQYDRFWLDLLTAAGAG